MTPKRRKQTLPRRTVALTEPQWRAVAAMLFVAANSSTSNREQATLFYTIYGEVAKQINYVPNPVQESHDE